MILEASQVEDATDAVLKEHAIPAPLSEDMSHLVLQDAQFEEIQVSEEDVYDEDSDSHAADPDSESESESDEEAE